MDETTRAFAGRLVDLEIVSFFLVFEILLGIFFKIFIFFSIGSLIDEIE